MTELRKVTLDEYVCEHWALSPDHLRGINLFSFNRGDKVLPLSKSDIDGKAKTESTGWGSFGWRPAGYIPDRGPIVYFATLPFEGYIRTLTPESIRIGEHHVLNVNPDAEYSINVFTAENNQFEQFCQKLKSRLHPHVKMDEVTMTNNDYKHYGRGGGDGGDFHYRKLESSELDAQSEPSAGDVRQYISGLGYRHRGGFMYANQIQIRWRGNPDSSMHLIKAVANEVVENKHEAHFDLYVDQNGQMGRIGITGVFYKP